MSRDIALDTDLDTDWKELFEEIASISNTYHPMAVIDASLTLINAAMHIHNKQLRIGIEGYDHIGECKDYDPSVVHEMVRHKLDHIIKRASEEFKKDKS